MTIELNEITTVFISLLVYAIGVVINNNFRFLHKFAIPAPVIGGLLFAIISTILTTYGVINIKLNTDFQSLFMLAFFTTIGLGSSFSLLKLGGKLLIIYWLACGFLALAQNIIGVGMAKVLGIDPLIGVLLGATSMEGGHGAATAFGTTIEKMGVEGALSIGLASATLGLVAGGIIGGPIVKYLINKHKLTSKDAENISDNSIESLNQNQTNPLTTTTFMTTVILITFCMTLGSYLGTLFTDLTHFALPDYVGAMFLAVIVRNIIDKTKPTVINMPAITIIGDISLAIFLSMALMSINLKEISNLALPLILIISVQVLFITLISIFILFKILGKNYDSAIMIAGFTGHGLGATPNAIANMDAVTKQHGPSKTAFLIVPLVGAFLIDAFAVPIIITTINLFSH